MGSSNVVIRQDVRPLDKILRFLKPRTDDAIRDELDAMEADIQAHWSSSSPSAPGSPPAVVTGELKNSIEKVLEGNSRRPNGVLRVKAQYADFLEFGTSKMAARPFLRPAVYRAVERFNKRLKKVVLP